MFDSNNNNKKTQSISHEKCERKSNLIQINLKHSV